MTTYLWVDCDPGHDDAFALILACHSANPAVIVAGVSTVCGNQTVDKTTDNALRVASARQRRRASPQRRG